MAVPATVLYYTCYDQLKEWMGYENGKSSLAIPMACGGIARGKSRNIPNGNLNGLNGFKWEHWVY